MSKLLVGALIGSAVTIVVVGGAFIVWYLDEMD